MFVCRSTTNAPACDARRQHVVLRQSARRPAKSYHMQNKFVALAENDALRLDSYIDAR